MGALNNNEHPNVGFKLGTDQALQALLLAGTNANATHGTFYLTQDTHRLYVGNADHSISAVNEGIIFVDRVSGATGSETQLPTPSSSDEWKAVQGQFYYCSTDNILCVASGNRWVQINPDTYVTSFTVGVTTTNRIVNGDTEIGSATITDTVNQANHGSANIPASSSSDFTIAMGSPNLHMDVTGRTLTLSCDAGATYTLTQEAITNGVRVNLIGSNNTTDYFDIIKDTTNGCAITPTLVNDKIVLTGGTADTFELHLYDSTSAIGQAAGLTAGQFMLSLEDDSGKSTELTLKPQITLEDNLPYTATYNSTTGVMDFDLPVYTKDQVDALINESNRQADAMHFAGTITSATGGAASSVNALATAISNGTLPASNGDTYKVAEDGVVTGNVLVNMPADGKVEVGDLIIVQGQEYQDTDSSNATTYIAPNAANHDALIGKIVPSTAQYHYIPSGDDKVDYYVPNFTEDNNAVKFTNHNDSTDVHQLNFAAGTQIALDHNVPTGSNNKTITINHAAIAAPTSSAGTAVSGYNPSFTALTDLTINNGHITGYELTQLTVTPNEVTSMTTNAAAVSVASGTGAQITNNWTHSNGTTNGVVSGNDDYKSNGWKLTSTSLNIGVNAAGINGGTSGTNAAADIKVDLVWGSF